MNNILILGIVFLIPAIFVIVKNYLWDISYWQKKSFKFENFIKNYSWDLEIINRKPLLNILKFSTLALLSLLFIDTFLGSLGIILAYIIWVVEFYTSLENIIRFKEPEINLLKPKTLLLVLLSVLLILLTVFTISYPFAVLDTVTSTVISNGVFDILPDYYLYLGLLSFNLLLLDILSSTVLILLRVLLLPIDLVNNLIVKFVAITKLESRLKNRKNRDKKANHLKGIRNESNNANLKIITLTGFNNDNYLQIFLLNLFNEYIPQYLTPSDNVFKQIYYLLNKRSKVLVLNLDKGNNKYIKNVKVDFNITNTLPFKNDLVNDVKSTNNEFNLSNIIYLNNSIECLIKFKDQSETILLPGDSRIYLFIPEIFNILINLGYSFRKSVDIFNNVVKRNNNIFLKGDNNIKLINFSNSEIDAKHLIFKLKNLSSIKNNNKLILLTNGFEINSKEYLTEIISELKNYVDILITSNKKLYNISLNEDIECFRVTSLKDYAYLTRLYSKENDYVLIEGHLKPYVLKELVAN